MKDFENNNFQSDREDSTGKQEQQHAYKSFTKDKRTDNRSSERTDYRRNDNGSVNGGRRTEGYHNEGERRSNSSYGERREGGYNREGGNYNRSNSNNKEGGSYNREGGYSRPNNYNRDNSSNQRSNDGEQRKRSFNPNFDSSNRLVGQIKDAYDRGDNNGNTERSDRNNASRGEYKRYDNNNREGYKPRGEYNNSERKEGYKRYGDSNSQGDYKPRGEYKKHDNSERKYNSEGGSSYSERPQRQSYGEAGQRSSYSNKPYGERRYDNSDRNGSSFAPREKRSYDNQDRPERSGSYGNKPYNKEGYSSNKPYNKEGYGNKPYNKEGYGNREFKQSFDKRDGDRRMPKYSTDNYPTFPAPVIEDKIRLNRYISMSGICSRREADEFIQSGVVTVNGLTITELGAKVSQNDEICFNGNIIKNEQKVYIVMNKPKGYVTSVEDPHADKTVIDLLNDGCRERVYPVGRLDKNSLGVLLITNDGDLAKKLMHPSYEKKKVYQVSLDKPLTRFDLDSLVAGFNLEDGEIHADAASYVDERKTEIGVEIHSGRNRIVRRMFEHLGYRVTKLDRVYFAGLTKQRLKRGEWRFLTPREVQALQSNRYE